MDVIKICTIGIVTAFCVFILKDIKSDMATLLGIVGGLLIVFLVVNQLTDIFGVFENLTSKTGISKDFLGVIIKIVGLGFIIDFAAGICEDLGSKSLGEKIVLGGKIAILYVSLPVVVSLFDIITSLL